MSRSGIFCQPTLTLITHAGNKINKETPAKHYRLILNLLKKHFINPSEFTFFGIMVVFDL